MFTEHYSFHKANTERPVNDKYLVCIHNYTFKADNTPYIVRVEEYTDNIYIIKYFRKQDRKNKNRFNVLTGENKCTKIVTTCIYVLISILEKNELASFGFLGSNTITDSYEEDKSNTQRFKIYKYAMENLIGEHIFIHSMDKVSSTYLMVNKKNPSPSDFIIKARAMFDEIFPELED